MAWQRGCTRAPAVPATRLLGRKAVAFLLAASLLSCLFPNAAQAQAPEPGTELTIYIMTMGPGDQVWERFGHNAIWVHDAARGTDIAYNWGMFDFADADFLPRFIRGDMRYYMAGFGVAETLDMYRSRNRAVHAQRLNLTPAERVSVRDFVEWNARPENRYYGYDYYRDNCSTRLRDVLDRALGGALRQQTAHVATPRSYRFHTRRLTQAEPFVFTGTLIGLGQPVDTPLSAWEEMFLPMKLMEHVRRVRVTRAGSAPVPLVAEERLLLPAARGPEPAAPRRFFGTYLLGGFVAGAAFVWFGSLALRGKGSARAALVSAGVWNMIAGMAGLVLLALWLFTNHRYSYHNENLLHLNPLSLILGLLLLRYAFLTGKRRRDIAPALLLAIAVAGASLLGFVLQAFSAFDQENGEVIALTLPVHLGALAAVLLLRRKRKA